MKEKPGDSKRVSRRRVLRGAAVLAGTAGAGIAGAATATPAEAAAGAAVVQGAANDAGGTATGLRNVLLNGPALQLANDATTTENGAPVAGPALQLKPGGTKLADAAPVGSLGMSTDGTLWMTTGVKADGSKFRDWVYTNGNANMTVPVEPTRVIDTRDPKQRGRILNASGNLDSLGRLIGGHRIDIDLSQFVFFSYGVFANLTAVQPVADGYLSMYPYAPTSGAPTTSNVNYSKLLYAQSNFAMSGVGRYRTTGSSVVRDAVTLFTNMTTHVIVDVVGFIVPGWEYVNLPVPGLPTGASIQSATADALRDVQAPSWFTGET